jgi:hypothetical protein
LQPQAAVNVMRWYWNTNFAHYSVSSKRKLYLLGSMPQTKTLPAYTIHSELLRDRITLAVARALPILEWAPAKGQRAEVVKEKDPTCQSELGYQHANRTRRCTAFSGSSKFRCSRVSLASEKSQTTGRLTQKH